MQKLIRGVVEFREKVRPSLLDKFEQLALGQRPDVLLVTCSDSRVAVNVFASTNPGDMFVLRNIGNIIPPITSEISSYARAGLEFALDAIQVRHVVICGHSECGAMIAIHNGIEKIKGDGLKEWLKDGIANFESPDNYNELSKKNVLLQLEHLKTYPLVQQKIADGSIQIHGWYFDIKNADVYFYSFENKRFELLDAEHAEGLLEKLGS
jgi:carbonic anhydrase